MAIQQKIAKVKGVADIVFVIDATGSMQPCIDNVKANVENFASSIATYSANTKVDWRARVLAYRDLNVDTNALMNNFPFVSDPSAIKNQLDKIEADGGGDEPESTLDAIAYATLKSDWRANAHKVIVVFTDATPLPNFSSKTISELGIQDDIEIFFQLLVENKIKLFFYGPKHEIYEELSKVSRTIVTQYDDAEAGLVNADFKSILDTIGKTVSQIVSGGDVL